MFTYDEATFSDVHKDATGFRPYSDHEFYSASPERKQQIWDNHINAVIESIDNEKRQNIIAMNRFEKTITDLIAKGAGDRTTAIKWFVDSLGIDMEDVNFYGATYLCFEANLPYSAANIFVDALNIKFEH